MKWYIGLFLILALSVSGQARVYEFDTEIVDLPFNVNVVGETISYPSMSQAVRTAQALHELLYFGLDQVFPMYRKGWMKFWYGAASGVAEILYMYIPGGSAWLHEEFHRNILTEQGIASFDEVYEFPFFRSVVQVKQVKDSDLIRLKENSPQDLVRLSAAGIEGESLLIRSLRQSHFFDGKDAARDGMLIFIETLNPLLYLWTCTQTSSDSDIDHFNRIQTNVSERDFTGYDFTAWVYDLFRPNEPYTNRGVHPLGNGTDRYIKVSDLSDAELDYLKLMVWLNTLNLIAPSSLGIQSFRAEVAGSPFYWNFDLTHFLAPFGFAVDLNLYFKSGEQKYYVILRNQFNRLHWYPALEVTRMKMPIFTGLTLTPSVGLALQPEHLLFEDEKSVFAGFVRLRADLALNKQTGIYLEGDWKNAGWWPGQVSLSTIFDLRGGLHWNL